jgi:anti-sigma regulatory factor (Ser/Thr protein kinase)
MRLRPASGEEPTMIVNTAQSARGTKDERARLEALRRYRILDTDPERAFDDLALLASHICGTPMALISLVDADRQWFKARVGITTAETARSIAFCSHAIEHEHIYIISDTQDDVKFRDNPFVRGEPHIRFYAGAPLVTPDGHALGTLCVLDRVSRTLTPDQLEALDALKRQAEAQLELRRNLMDLQAALDQRDNAEAEQAALVTELRGALDNVKKLSGLIPFCSVCQFNMVIPADPRAIPTVTDGVVEMLQSKNWKDEDIMAVELALQEAVANAIRHGCKNDPSKHLQCCVTCDQNGEVMILVRDPGPGFDTTAVANPLDEANILKPSGRGIFLINGLMDEVGFRDGGRELLMRKRRDKQP